MSMQERVSSMPRAVLWAILATIALGVYFFAVEPAIGAISDFNAKAETRSIELQRLKSQLQDREPDLLALAKGERTHGPIAGLRTASSAYSAAEYVINEAILDLESIDSWTLTNSMRGFSEPSLEREFVGPSQELVRWELNFNFEASPEDVVEAIRRFEASPSIHAISAVRLRLAGQDERRLSAQLTIEVWAISERGGVR